MPSMIPIKFWPPDFLNKITQHIIIKLIETIKLFLNKNVKRYEME